MSDTIVFGQNEIILSSGYKVLLKQRMCENGLLQLNQFLYCPKCVRLKNQMDCEDHVN